MKVYETDDVVRYLRKRNIIKPYLKAKGYFEAGHPQAIRLKLLKPKQHKEYQFRINTKYRARGFYKEDGFLVTSISDYQ